MPHADPARAPLLEAVLQASRSGALRLHTPAHRGQPDPEYGAALGAALALDLTELDETDDLRDPRGAIAQAQDLAAAHFGADRTWFLVNGASAGNCAALLAIASRLADPLGNPSGGTNQPRTRKIVVGRDAHVSILNGLVLADLEPVWVPAGWDAAWDVAVPPSAEAYAAAIAAHPDALAIVVTGPSYFGDRADVPGIRKAAGDRPLIVDEAHGAHIPRALAAGADIVVHSAHKGLSGPTQGGYLHLRGDRVQAEPIATALRMLQSTSPNYWILAGLDAARRAAACAPAHQDATPASRPLAVTPSPAEALRSAGLTVRHCPDPARILVRFPDGFAAYDALAARGIVAEAALPGAVLFLAVGLDERALEALTRACQGTFAGPTGLEPASQPRPLPPPLVRRAPLPPRTASLGASSRIPLAEARGRICAEAVCPYPPGIPVLVPGEEIAAEALAFLARHAPDLETVAVVEGYPPKWLVTADGRGSP